MAYASRSVTFGEQPSAAKWNILGTNDASFNDGTGIGADAIKSSQMFYGLVRNRQGGTTGAGSWVTTGSSNTDVSATDTFIQVGSKASSNGGAVSVTFPTAYTQAPVVVISNNTSGAAHFAEIEATPTTTGFSFAVWNTVGALVNNEPVFWVAIGQ